MFKKKYLWDLLYGTFDVKRVIGLLLYEGQICLLPSFIGDNFFVVFFYEKNLLTKLCLNYIYISCEHC